MSQLKKGERERIYPSSIFLFYLGLSTDWMMPTHTGEGRSCLLSLLIQMLISSVNTLTGLLRNVLPAIWASLSRVKLTHKINLHTYA